MDNKKHCTIDGIPCVVVRRKGRKRITILANDNGECEIRVPWNCSLKTVEFYVKKDKDWILKAIEEKKAKPRYKISDEEIENLRAKAEAVIPDKIDYYCKLMGIEPPEKVTITAAKTRWGSCTSKRHINISLYLMQYPEEAIDYVIVHEIAHLKELNHSKNFWSIVESVFPDYKRRKALLN